MDSSNEFYRSVGLTSTGNDLFINGAHLRLSDFKSIDRAIAAGMNSGLPTLQRATYYGELRDGDDVLDFVLNQPGTVTRLCSRAMDMEGSIISSELSDPAGAFQRSLKFMSAPGKEFDIKPSTVLLAADFDSVSGQRLLFEALKYQVEASPTGCVDVTHFHRNGPLNLTIVLFSLGFFSRLALGTLAQPKQPQDRANCAINTSHDRRGLDSFKSPQNTGRNGRSSAQW